MAGLPFRVAGSWLKLVAWKLLRPSMEAVTISSTVFSLGLSTVRLTLATPSRATAMNLPPAWPRTRAWFRIDASLGFSRRRALAVLSKSAGLMLSGTWVHSDGTARAKPSLSLAATVKPAGAVVVGAFLSSLQAAALRTRRIRATAAAGVEVRNL